MMPFSVLRVWGLGILSWCVLGLGIYLAVQSYDRFRRTDSLPGVIEVQDEQVERMDVADQRIRRPAENTASADGVDWKFWALVAGAATCLGISFGGFWPISFLLGNAPDKNFPEVSPTKTMFVERPDGVKLHVEFYGEQDRPLLLLTHGWSLDTSAWNYIKGDLSRRFRLVVWDLPGMGRSTCPPGGDYSLERMARDLEGVMQATAADAPLVLVGHSIGGMIQQTFCRLYPEQLGPTVQGMALVHTTYTNPVRTNLAATALTLMETPILVPLTYLTIALSPLAWLSNWQSYFNGSLHITTRFTSFSGRQTRRQLDHGARLAAAARPAAVARGNLEMLKFNEERTLPQVHIPVLVIGAEHDRMTLSSASDHIEHLLPNDRPCRIKGGHLGHWESSDRVVELLTEFAEHVAAHGPTRDSKPVAPATDPVTSVELRR